MAASKIPGVFAFDMQAKAEERPDFQVLLFENHPHPPEPLTYAELAAKGDKLTRALRAQGIGRGDTFSLLMRNHPEVIIAMYAGSALGAVVVPIDPRSRGDKLAYQLKDSGSKGILFSAELMENFQEAWTFVPEVRPMGVLYKDEFGVPPSPEFPDLREVWEGPGAPGPDASGQSPRDHSMIIYTSGTTGNPKGVRIRAERTQAFSLLAQFVWQYTQEDRLYTGLSLTHGNAHAVTLAPALALSIPAVISRKFTKSRIWDICREYGCTTFSLLGGMMMGIYSEPERPEDADNPVRKVISAGTPLPIWEAFEKRFGVKIHEWYGAVEGGFAHNPPGEGPVGSFGKPLQGFMEMRVVREDDTECGPGELGELVCRMTAGPTEVEYHGKPEASEAKTRGGWLRTGDFCHTDEAGWFYFDYRKGGGLRRQGDFILPEYVERVIAERPDVNEVCVFGIPAASGAPGESDLVAAVVPTAGTEIDIGGIFAACRAGLEANSVPSYLQVVSEIPKTISEKNLDRLLMEAFSKDAPGVYRLEDFR